MRAEAVRAMIAGLAIVGRDSAAAMSLLPRINVLGVGISAINLQQAVGEIERWIAIGARHYVNVCNVHTVMECQRAPTLRDIVNHSGLSTPDGMPLVWLTRWHGHRSAARVYGPDLMLTLCDRSQTTGHRHFFYGGAPGVAERLTTRLQQRFPALVIAGRHTPPFRPADTAETSDVIEAINAARPDIVWVGLGTPKQDYWIARHRAVLEAPVLIAIGAAFDFHAGLLPQAPVWMQHLGLEWLFRLVHEPRRLGYRYLVYNPRFVANALLQVTRLRRFPAID
jgi:N-acetylglucosaminyldiphosphoundecaprenol N-acetyl-beta-D-mannosaminyltransferase